MLAREECRSLDKRNNLTEYDLHAVEKEVGMFTSNVSHQLDSDGGEVLFVVADELEYVA